MYAGSLSPKYIAIIDQLEALSSLKLSRLSAFYESIPDEQDWSEPVSEFRRCFVRKVLKLDSLITRTMLMGRRFFETRRINIWSLGFVNVLINGRFLSPHSSQAYIDSVRKLAVDPQTVEIRSKKRVVSKGYFLVVKYHHLFGEALVESLLRVMDLLLAESPLLNLVRADDSQYMALESGTKAVLSQLICPESLFPVSFDSRPDRLAFYLFNLLRTVIEKLHTYQALVAHRILIRHIVNTLKFGTVDSIQLVKNRPHAYLSIYPGHMRLVMTSIDLQFAEYQDSVRVVLPGWENQPLLVETDGSSALRTAIDYNVVDVNVLSVKISSIGGITNRSANYVCYVDLHSVKFDYFKDRKESYCYHIWKPVGSIYLVYGLMTVRFQDKMR